MKQKNVRNFVLSSQLMRKWQARGTVVILFYTLDMYNMVYVVVGHETATKGFGHVQYRF